MADTAKKPNFFVRAARGLAKWFREMKSELKKVVWPDRKQMINNTLIVLAVAIVVGVIVCLFDLVAGLGIDLLGKLF